MALDPLTAAFDLGKIAIEKIFPDKTKRAEEMRKLEQMRQDGELERLNAHVQLMLGQLKVNEQEAAHKSIFVAGWRPFIGWVCGVGVFWQFVGHPIGEFIAVLCGYAGELPSVKSDDLFELLMGMLGLGGLRTFEKLKGVSREK